MLDKWDGYIYDYFGAPIRSVRLTWSNVAAETTTRRLFNYLSDLMDRGDTDRQILAALIKVSGFDTGEHHKDITTELVLEYRNTVRMVKSGAMIVVDEIVRPEIKTRPKPAVNPELPLPPGVDIPSSIPAAIAARKVSR